MSDFIWTIIVSTVIGAALGGGAGACASATLGGFTWIWIWAGAAIGGIGLGGNAFFSEIVTLGKRYQIADNDPELRDD